MSSPAPVVNLRPRRCDVRCSADLPFTLVVTYGGIDLSGYGASATVKDGNGTAVLSATSGAGITLSFDGTNTQLVLRWDQPTMATVPSGNYAWALLPEQAGVEQPSYGLVGRFTVEPEFRP